MSKNKIKRLLKESTLKRFRQLAGVPLNEGMTMAYKADDEKEELEEDVEELEESPGNKREPHAQAGRPLTDPSGSKMRGTLAEDEDSGSESAELGSSPKGLPTVAEADVAPPAAEKAAAPAPPAPMVATKEGLNRKQQMKNEIINKIADRVMENFDQRARIAQYKDQLVQRLTERTLRRILTKPKQ